MKQNIRRRLRLIYAALLILEKYPQSKVKALLIAHLAWLSRTPITPAIQVLLDRAIIAFGPFETAVSVKTIDISGGSADVVSFDEMKVTLPARIDEIKTMVKSLMKGNKAILKFLDLDNVGIFYLGKQSDIFENITNLETKITATPALVTVIPLATALKNDVKNPLKAKSDQFDDIKDDRTDITPLILDAKMILIRNFGALSDIFWENLAKVVDYFPVEDLDPATHTDTFLPINKFKIVGTQGTAFHLVDVVYKYGNFIEADLRKCNFSIDLFLASEITSVVPKNAQRINKGDRIIFKTNTIGSSTEGYLMCVVAEDETVTEEGNFFITIDKTKPQRKNIIAPVTVTPEPVVVTPIPVVVTPEPKL